MIGAAATAQRRVRSLSPTVNRRELLVGEKDGEPRE